MARLLGVLALVVVIAVGCRVPPDREDLKLFDEKKTRFAYADLYLRARSQANLALEAFYADSWPDLDEAAKGLEQTARFLPKATDTPTDARPAEQLQADALRLGEAARAKDVRVANEVLQRIQFNIRTLRPKDVAPKE
ncbi:MAG: hypothetical protein WCL32_18375 [Planctomycetota bacterium]|jgi:hypothetical protein